MRNQRPEDHAEDVATEEPAAGHLTYNQIPAYIRGSGPLD
jgi:hypothetical protein